MLHQYVPKKGTAANIPAKTVNGKIKSDLTSYTIFKCFGCPTSW